MLLLFLSVLSRKLSFPVSFARWICSGCKFWQKGGRPHWTALWERGSICSAFTLIVFWMVRPFTSLVHRAWKRNDTDSSPLIKNSGDVFSGGSILRLSYISTEYPEQTMKSYLSPFCFPACHLLQREGKPGDFLNIVSLCCIHRSTLISLSLKSVHLYWILLYWNPCLSVLIRDRGVQVKESWNRWLKGSFFF